MKKAGIIILSPVAEIFGFSPLPLAFFLLIGVIVLFYVVTAELAKTVSYQRVKI